MRGGAGLLVVAALSLVACVHGGHRNEDAPDAALGPEIDKLDAVEDAIRAVLEGLRENPAIYPSLDFEGRTRQISNDNTNLSVSFRNAEIIGLPNFVTENVTYVLVPSTVYLTLSFDELIITAENYGIFGVIAGVLLMNADGPFELRFGNANLDANARAKVSSFPSLSIELQDLVADITAQSFTMEMVNMFSDEGLTDEFNLMMSTIGIDILHEFKDEIDAVAARYLQNLLNGLLADLLGGKGERGGDAKHRVELAASEAFADVAVAALGVAHDTVAELYNVS